MPAPRDLERDTVQVEIQIRRPGGLGGTPAQGARGREPALEEAAGGVDARQRGAQGPARKKRLKPAAQRMSVSRVMERHGLSQRHACRLVGMDRSTLRYQGKQPDDSALRQRLRELAAERRRFGYRRLGWMLAREGHALNHKKLYRLYREERLMVRRRRGRKRALSTRAPMTLPIRINQRWSLDFVSDTFGDGRRFRILCIVDDFSRECLATVVDTSLSGVRVVRELEQLIRERGKPKIIVSDNGTELTSVAVLRWVPGRVTWHYIEPG